MVLLWGIPGDEPLAMVHAALARQQEAVVFVDQQAILEARVDLTVGSDVCGTLHLDSQVVDLGRISAAYLRPYDSRRLPAIAEAGPESSAWAHALSLEDTLLCWCELTTAFVVNRPSAMASNNSKPYQAALIRSLGMKTPDTLVTTDPAAALEFWEEHGSVIYKSASGVRSIVSRLTAEHAERLKEIESCPTQFQEHVDGVDVRVHVVGDITFACEIESEADDYRYAGSSGAGLQIRPCNLPPDTETRCRVLADRLELSVAGIDLRRTPAGEWYCFEVNPSPGFSFYETATGQPISEAIAGLLASSGQLQG